MQLVSEILLKFERVKGKKGHKNGAGDETSVPSEKRFHATGNNRTTENPWV